jgi:hypothetical protein
MIPQPISVSNICDVYVMLAVVPIRYGPLRLWYGEMPMQRKAGEIFASGGYLGIPYPFPLPEEKIRGIFVGLGKAHIC